MIDKMLKRRDELEALKLEIDKELHAITNALLVAGITVRRGRPPTQPTHTVSEAREAHRRWSRGERDNDWVRNGERQYQREIKRARMAGAA